MPRARGLLEVPLEDFNQSVNLMVYGMTGVGKTSLAATLPSNTFLSAEPGIIAAKRRADIVGTKPRAVRVKNWEDAETAIRMAEDGEFKTEWLTVDTLSSIQQLAYRYWTARAHGLNPKQDEDIPDLQGHQKVQFMTRRWVSRLVDTPYNILFLCHAMQTENNDGSAVWLPSIEGQAKRGYAVAQYVMGLMNAVGYMGVREIKPGKPPVRRIIWHHTEDARKDVVYTAKDQFSALGAFTDDASMPDLLAMIAAPAKPAKPSKKSGK